MDLGAWRKRAVRAPDRRGARGAGGGSRRGGGARPDHEAKGLTREQAQRLEERLVAERETALDTLAREELGIDPEELGGPPLQAAAPSFLLFCVGAVPPVLPFAFLGGLTAVAASLALSGAVLFGIGAAITLLTGRSALFSGARQLVIGFVAAGITYAIGALIGTAV
jgi:vacuolar iron transporter family protein